MIVIWEKFVKVLNNFGNLIENFKSFQENFNKILKNLTKILKCFTIDSHSLSSRNFVFGGGDVPPVSPGAATGGW